MKSFGTHFSIAEYCAQFARGEIRINTAYQRTNKVWPAAVRSYLIDSILLDYPIPKILLRQHTNLETRETVKEVVDGQQRTQAIFDFFSNRFAISLRESNFFGKRYSTLDDYDKQKFVDYNFSADVFTDADDDDIRETFRRMNSYTFPLNRQELRHATELGEYKWFILGLTESYTQDLKDLGVVTEREISRMGDAEFFTHVIAAVENGIETSSPKKLDTIYGSSFSSEAQRQQYRDYIDAAMMTISRLSEVVIRSRLSSRYMFYSLVLAAGNAAHRIPTLEVLLDFKPAKVLESPDVTAANLLNLIAAVEEWQSAKEEYGTRAEPAGPFADFIAASTEATNTKKNREIRFKWLSRALLPIPVD